MQNYSCSFLIGWGLKSLVTRFGGADGYRKCKPLMIGIIAGEMLIGIVFMGVGAVYYMNKGIPPKGYSFGAR